MDLRTEGLARLVHRLHELQEECVASKQASERASAAAEALFSGWSEKRSTAAHDDDKDANFPAGELSHGSESKGEREEEQKQLADLDRILAKAKEARTVRITEQKKRLKDAYLPEKKSAVKKAERHRASLQLQTKKDIKPKKSCPAVLTKSTEAEGTTSQHDRETVVKQEEDADLLIHIGKDMKMPGKYRKAISVNQRLTCQLDEEFAGSRDDYASQPFISQLEQTFSLADQRSKFQSLQRLEPVSPSVLTYSGVEDLVQFSIFLFEIRLRRLQREINKMAVEVLSPILESKERIDPQIYNAASFILQPHTVRQFQDEDIHHS